ncbi:lipase family protein [Ascidiimonas sp. W6]|uniref:lipase family protein n=1 Tax=Ascidiimonas meishanensis TaxID=3128903 RepID=UPI0030EB9CC8
MSNISRYIELAKICKATYQGPINQHQLTYNEKVLNHQKIVHGSYKRGFCRIFWNADTVIISFRGTREIIDWFISNIKFRPVVLKNNPHNFKTIWVHRGFQRTLLNYDDKTTGLKSLQAVWKHIQDNNLFNGRKIVITGHSLGGALAILFAVRLRMKYRKYSDLNLVEIVTFGAPAVGLKGFKKYYHDLSSKTIRVVNGSDIVPFTPPLFYHHVGNEIWLNEQVIKKNSGWFVRFAYALKLPLKKFMQDHSMDQYIEKLIFYKDA